MINKPLDLITKNDLQLLIENKVVEGKTIEYKSEIPLKMESQKIPFLAGLSAFANTIGGDMIFGVEAPDGIPTKINGLDKTTIDDDKLRLESAIRSGIEPKLSRYEVKSIDVDDSKYVLIFRVYRSWMAPHMVIFNSHGKFYGRHSSGKYPLDVNEIKRAILLSEIGGNKARNFREERAFKISGNDTYLRMSPGAKYIIHIIPQQSISSDFNLKMNELSNYENWPSIPGSWNPSNKINIDGILLHPNSADEENQSYLQWYRSGIMEFVFQAVVRDGKGYVPAVAYEKDIIFIVENAIQKMQKVGIEVPIYVFLTMMGFKGYIFGAQDIRMGTHSSSTTENNFIIPEIEIKNYADSVSKALRPIFDTVWNAFGYKGSMNYNTSGSWRPFNQQ